MAKKHEMRSTKTTPPVEEEVDRRELIKAADFFSIYSNDFQVHTGPWDMRLIFGEVGDNTKDGVIVKQLGEMRMSPQIAKRLTKILLVQLENYEEKFGQIPEPKP